ncbi:MAG: hypothetical protein EOR46_04320 [Mesorhizobium sp.]|nr:hypothetical protein [Mesorhizobium sp.]RWK43685.1 MAG: hypothetical protein EOR46_04320 [Mesorhizobium sp.]
MVGELSSLDERQERFPGGSHGYNGGTMIKRTLGQSGLSIAPLGLGGNVFGWNVDEQTGFRLLDTFVDYGFNAIDTAGFQLGARQFGRRIRIHDRPLTESPARHARSSGHLHESWLRHGRAEPEGPVAPVDARGRGAFTAI